MWREEDAEEMAGWRQVIGCGLPVWGEQPKGGEVEEDGRWNFDLTGLLSKT